MSDLHRINGRWLDMPTAALCLHGVHRLDACERCAHTVVAVEIPAPKAVEPAPGSSVKDAFAEDVARATPELHAAAVADAPAALPDPPPSAPEPAEDSSKSKQAAPRRRTGSKKGVDE